MIINKQESEALNITRFVMSIFIVFFHAYTSVQMYDYWKDLPVYRGVVRFFALQIGEMGVPVFFLISGYLFFASISRRGCVIRVNCRNVFTHYSYHIYFGMLLLLSLIM